MKDFGIYYNEESQVFLLNTNGISYAMACSGGYLGHLYIGPGLSDFPSKDVLREGDYTYLKGNPGDKCVFMDGFPFEYSSGGIGDFRVSPLNVRNEKGFLGAELKVKGYEIYDGKKKLPGLPSTFGNENDTKSLDIILEDEALKLTVILSYSIFEGLDCVARSVRIKNDSEENIYLERALSSCLELPYRGHEVITLHGSWAREHIPERRTIGHGRVAISSDRGISSHQAHPFMALVSPETTETQGEAIGLSFVYSGNFMAEVERTQHDRLRVVMGISVHDFDWCLAPGKIFQTPEVLVVYSSDGLGKMSRTFHDIFRNHLIRSKYLHKERPVLINNWEATYFDFDMDKLLEIAAQAKQAGIEMLVMDDGWFRKRDSDDSSLGDWTVNKAKLPLGLTGLCEKINNIGLDMGIWFEPEMISPDSNLYREHPDWALAIPGRDASECRNQFVLDITRSEVRDYVYECVASVLRETNIKYIKWDMNRPLTDVGSLVTRGGEIHHRYMLGVYELMERLVSEFPDLLLENCSSGGGRFDPGMLYYSPQVWCSDDTDAMERLYIQEGTALIYPPSSIGAHVSICPNHIVGRTVDFRTRGYVALAGTFGYELDIRAISDEEKEIIKEQVSDYKKYNHLVREGDYFRIISSDNLTGKKSEENSLAWMFVSKEKDEALLTYIQERGNANKRSETVRLQGLIKDARYRLEDGREYQGDELMNIGFTVDKLYGDGAGRLYHFSKI